MTSKPIPIWLDCDPGHDDAFAILLALDSPWWKLVGISTVHGNSSLQHTTHNALALLTAFKRPDIKVYPGAAKSLDGHYSAAATIHGESGLEGTNLLPEPVNKPQAESAVNAMKNAINQYQGQLAIVATGALTNIANLINSCTETELKNIKYLSIMGGSIGFGNWSKYAEFNIWIDVQAAELVLNNDILIPKTIIVPLNLTHQAIVTEEIAKKIRGNGSIVRQMLYELIEFFRSTYKQQFDFKTGPPLHDPLAVYVLLYFMNRDRLDVGVQIPDIELEFTRNLIHIVQTGEKKGQMKSTSQSNGIYVAFNANFEIFWDLMFKAIDQISNEIN